MNMNFCALRGRNENVGKVKKKDTQDTAHVFALYSRGSHRLCTGSQLNPSAISTQIGPCIQLLFLQAIFTGCADPTPIGYE